MPAQSMKRQWTADSATNKKDSTPVKKSRFDDDIIQPPQQALPTKQEEKKTITQPIVKE